MKNKLPAYPAPDIHNHPWLPKDKYDAAIRGCVSALLRGAYEEERDFWRQMFLILGAKDDAEVDRIVETICQPMADEAIKDEMAYLRSI